MERERLVKALRELAQALESQEGGIWAFDIIRRNGDGAILSLRFTQKDVRPMGVEAAEPCDQCGKSH